jgi:hypothetical protein
MQHSGLAPAAGGYTNGAMLQGPFLLQHTACSTATQLESQPVDKNQVSLRSILDDLRKEDQRCILIARGVKHLGFRSKQVLEKYFAQYGVVFNVFVPTSKTTKTSNVNRPGNMGIIVMRSAECAQGILARGTDHWIKHAWIHVAMYEPDFALGRQSQAENSGPGAKPASHQSQGYRKMEQDDGKLSCDSVGAICADYSNLQAAAAAAGGSGKAEQIVLLKVQDQLSNLEQCLHRIKCLSQETGVQPHDELIQTMGIFTSTQRKLQQIGHGSGQIEHPADLQGEVTQTAAALDACSNAAVDILSPAPKAKTESAMRRRRDPQSTPMPGELKMPLPLSLHETIMKDWNKEEWCSRWGEETDASRRTGMMQKQGTYPFDVDFDTDINGPETQVAWTRYVSPEETFWL